ncbi:MAG: hypothetical protein AMS21_11365 [Gemmatimonas sp. SG8_38_2]|nr:MAG: hypothetical protein AMS21_11365 [Gemmatimonas sp. SG8_38_2]
MKKALLGVAVALALGLAGTSDAQAQGIHLGIQGGYNYAQLADVPTDFGEIADKGSFVIGAFVDIQFHKLLFIGVEGNYVEYKSEADSEVFKQGQIQIPAYLGVRLLSGMFQPNLYAGAAASFEASCDVASVSCEDADISTNSAIWSAVFGGGLDVALGFIRLNGDVRYNLGLSKILDEEGVDLKWNSWMVLVGAGIGLGN